MQKRPTHSAVTQFISSIVPSKSNDVRLHYHEPRHPKYNPDSAPVDQVVLSVTPTPGVYDFIGFDAPHTKSTASRVVLNRPPRTICFLHRPFTLERRRVRRGTLVLASHTSFDETITVGWNTALAERLGMNVPESVCIQGYKGDPERKMGIVGEVSILYGQLEDRIKQEFGAIGVILKGSSAEIRAVAIMNAFNKEEVERILEVARQYDWVQPGERDGGQVLYLTGQPRESGMSIAKEIGMSVVCVGHRTAEEWGIRYLAKRLSTAFPGLRVRGVYEEEETVEK